jgi:GntR family transcriptional regulator/MocR family aminotransferase
MLIPRTNSIDLLTLELQRDTAASIHSQLDTQLRGLIISGRLQPGAKLPSSRRLAGQLGCARNTVLAIFDQLISEGFLEGQAGAGTFVASQLDFGFLDPKSRKTSAQRAGARGLSKVGESLIALQRAEYLPGRPFALAGPDLSLFPAEVWGRLSARAWRQRPRELVSCTDPFGYPPLRTAIAQHVSAVSGASCDPDQVIVTAGATHAFELIVRLLVDPDEAIWVEDPCSSWAMSVLLAYRMRVVPVPVDEQGLSVVAGERTTSSARMAVLTPSHQYPLGVAMSLSRRLELLDWARRANAWIVEDDYDREFRYEGRPLPSLRALDVDNRVVYISTFSKALVSAFRTGYMVLPEDIAERLRGSRVFEEQSVALPVQVALADFMSEGHFIAHLQRSRRAYARKARAVDHFGRKHLSGLLAFDAPASGLHTVAKFEPALARRIGDADAAAALGKAGIIVTPLSIYAFKAPQPPGFVLGFGTLNEAQIELSMRKMARVLARL